MKNMLANILIDHVNNELAASTNLDATSVSLYSTPEIEENEAWKSLTPRMRKEVIAIAMKHFQDKGYTITFQHDNYFEFKYPYHTPTSLDDTQKLVQGALRHKALVTVPEAVNQCVNNINELIQKAAAKGHTSVVVDLSPYEKDMSEDLLYQDKVRIYNQAWRIMAEAGYYIHDANRAHKALVIWDEEREVQYQKENCAKADPEPAQPKKRSIFNWKK